MVLTETKWADLILQITEAFRLSDKESAKLKNNNVAKLIAAIPYNSECENMDRTALAHLGTYMLAKNEACRERFAHTLDDNAEILKRMQLMNHFQGGNQAVIRKGMNMLALIQLEDHKADIMEDTEAGKYNPVASGAWDYTKVREKLIKEINSTESSEMEQVMTAEGVPGYWDE